MKGDSNFVGGMYVSASALDRLQRIVGWEPTKRPVSTDPMGGRPLIATKDCPCDPCPQRSYCTWTCKRFDRWVERGPITKRAKRRATT